MIRPLALAHRDHQLWTEQIRTGRPSMAASAMALANVSILLAAVQTFFAQEKFVKRATS